MANIIRYVLRGDTGENWQRVNPVLLYNEVAYDRTANRLKFGDGTTPWKDLPYVAPDVVNDLTTGGTDKALSAEQGKALKALIDDKAGTGEVEEAPDDGNVYARGDKKWYKIQDGYVIKRTAPDILPVAKLPDWKVYPYPDAKCNPYHIITSLDNKKIYLFSRIIDGSNVYQNMYVIPTTDSNNANYGTYVGRLNVNTIYSSGINLDDGKCLLLAGELQCYYGLPDNISTSNTTTNLDVSGYLSNSSVGSPQLCWSPELKVFCFISNTRACTFAGGTMYNNGKNIREKDNTDLYNNFQLRSKSPICWSGALRLFVSCSSGGVLYAFYSSNGLDWYKSNTSFPNMGSAGGGPNIIWLDSLGVFMFSNLYNNNVYVSANGTSWETLSVPFRNAILAWSPEKKVCCAVAGDMGYISSDLQNWTLSPLPTSARVGWVIWNSAANAFYAFTNNSGGVFYVLSIE